MLDLSISYKLLIHRSKELIRRVLDVIMPRRCVGCRRTGTFLCSSCQNTLPRAFLSDPDLIACYEYNDRTVRRALWKLKYAGGTELAETFAGPLAEELLATLGELISPPEEGEMIALIPVPLHPKRLRQRGYNQAELIAQKIAEKIPEVMVLPSVLVRTKNTVSQTQVKSRGKREENMHDAFALSPHSAPLPRICIVIDDIITSGATTRACAQLLQDAGAPTVLRAAVAHGTL